MRNLQRHKSKPQSGTMADIAFLLLVFFMVVAYIPKQKRTACIAAA